MLEGMRHAGGRGVGGGWDCACRQAGRGVAVRLSSVGMEGEGMNTPKEV
jgi:hypothetical protein